MPATDSTLKTAFGPAGPWIATMDGRRVYADDLKIGPNSADLSIGAQILRIEPKGRQYVGKIQLEGRVIDLHDPDSFEAIPTDCYNGGYGITLMPGELYLAASRESFETDAPLWVPQNTRCRERHGTGFDLRTIEIETYFIQEIKGRSTGARVGISTNPSAGFGDYGFSGQWVLELQVAMPTKIRMGDRLAQVAFLALVGGKPEAPYCGPYRTQSGPTPARLGPDRFS